jgi:phage/plasmid primase-like uncharacterized protein
MQNNWNPLEALYFVPKDDRKVRLMVAAALFSDGGDAYEEAFLNWCDGVSDAVAHRNMWKWGRKSREIGIGSLYHLAKTNGWEPQTVVDSEHRKWLNTRATVAKALVEEKIEESRKSHIDRLAYLMQNSVELAEGHDHPYLIQKNITKAAAAFSSARIYRDEYLLIPGFLDGDAYDCQIIAPDCSKRFMRGGPGMVGLTSLIQGDDSQIAICEGFATALGYRMMTGFKTYCTFTADNSVRMAKKWRAEGNESLIYVADFDESGTGQRCADAVSPFVKEVVMPSKIGTDAWDEFKELL